MTTFAVSTTASSIPMNALDSAITSLTHHGFAIIDRGATTATLTGPGLNSTRQNPVLGATRVQLSVDGDRLSLQAELGGVDAMRRFLMRFPFLLGIGLGLFFGVAGGIANGQAFGVGWGLPGIQGWHWMLLAMAGAMLPVSPWLFLSPWMAKQILTRTQNALTTLVQNSVYTSGRLSS